MLGCNPTSSDEGNIVRRENKGNEEELKTSMVRKGRKLKGRNQKEREKEGESRESNPQEPNKKQKQKKKPENKPEQLLLSTTFL